VASIMLSSSTAITNLLGGGGNENVKTLLQGKEHMGSKSTILTTTTTSTLLATLNRNALGDISNKTSGQSVTTTVIQKKSQVVNNVEMIPVEEQNEDITTTTTVDIVNDDMSLMEHDEEIVDIDEMDGDNPQLVCEFIKDIYSYLHETERKFRISPDYLDGKIVTPKMRSVLIDWLIQVHLKFHLLQETLYLCVQIIDAYLAKQNVPKLKLQLVGVSAMFVAAKYEEMYVPAIDDFVYMTDNTYTKSEIRHMEIDILKTLNFLFSKPLPLHFLRRFSKAGKVN
jgi:G2/mitotic-specific cyclin-B2